MELVKNAVRVGNGAGVLLPRRYLNSRVRVILEPLNLEKDIFEILVEEGILKDVLGVYIVGSYARGEEDIGSDVDVLVVTLGIDKKIVRGKYEVVCVSRENLEKQMEENAFLVLSMILEARVILNGELLKKYADSSLNRKNLRWLFETTRSALDFVRKDLEISKELGDNVVSDGIAYSLVLRLRSLYLVGCIIEKKKYKKKDFLKLVKKVCGSEVAYESYLRSKRGGVDENGLSLDAVEKLVIYIEEKLKEVEKWARGRKD